MSSVRSDVESAIAAAKSFPSVSFVPQIPQMFTDDARFIAFKRSDHFAFDAISIALLVVAQMSMFGTRLALYRAFSLTTYFTIVVVLSDLCCVIFWSYIIITMCGRFGLAASICKKINNSTLYREVLDLVTILSVVTAGVYLFARVEGGQCPSETNIWLSQQCNPVGRAGSIPEDTVLLNYLMPVIAQVVFKGVRFRTIVIAWAVATACVTGAICSIQGWVQIYTILYSVFFLYISYEIERFMRVAYVQTLQTLVQTEGERDLESLRRDQEFTAERARLELHIITIQGVHDMQQAEQEKRAMELERDHLRSLIGNVAHDLKTPIQAISMGVEILKAECISAFAPCSSSSRTISHSNSGANSDDDIPSCKHGCSSLDAMSELPFDDLFRSMFATCRFMTMAINRSIDFTKASSNIQLVPSLETVNFHETLCGPVDCIRNLQAGVAIVVAPLPADMCPYVITDKHWLGENLLCALSNAVKYSMGGLVYINTVLSRSAFNLSLEDDLVPLTGDEIHYIRVTIIDSGIGISAEKRKNLFQPFRQAQRMAGKITKLT